MLTDKIRVDQTSEPTEPEDYFAAALGLIFTDDLRNQHGDPGATVVYKSARYGDVKLSVADPAGEDERRLFAHYLWNAGVYLAELISEEGSGWSVRGQTVIELGAGLGLGGIVSSLAGAREVVISDYPAREVLDNLAHNVQVNMPAHISPHPTVQGHEWGELTDDFSRHHKGHFSRILSADCLWMPWQHRNLAASMLHFLSPEPDARVFVLAGFHTGRAKLAPFFDVAADVGLEVECIEEVDVAGNTRPWVRERDGGAEDVTGRKRWLVVARLKRGRPLGGAVL